jgi:hypothetical protein
MKREPDPHYRHRFPAEIISHAGIVTLTSVGVIEAARANTAPITQRIGHTSPAAKP